MPIKLITDSVLPATLFELIAATVTEPIKPKMQPRLGLGKLGIFELVKLEII